ncbi:MAG: AzlC family ABC transporter permease [Blautia sp.]|nr:AzlC family ABC transporter permease [Blautia sp.]
MEQSSSRSALKAAFPKTLPVMAGYLVLGFGFGLLLQSKGYAFWWAPLMGITIYAGSMQYVAVDLLSTGAGLIATALMTLMINARHLFYGISMLGRYRDTGRVKPYLIFGLTDETYSLLCTGDVPEGVEKNRFYFWITILNQIYWVVGSTLGALFGTAVSINTKGVDFSMTALFTVILTDNLLKKDSRLPALAGMAISFICLLIFGPDNFLIPSMLCITAALLLMRPVLGQKKEAIHDGYHA